MRHAWIAALLLLGCLGSARAEDLPQELQSLQPLLDDQTRLEEAIRTFDQTQSALADEAIEAAKNEKDAALAKEKLDSSKQRFELIRKAYEIGLRHYDGSARLHNYYGELLYDRFEEQGKALKEWNTALALDSKCGNAHNNLGLHEFHAGNYRMGIHHMDEALRLEPKNPDYLYNMAQMYLVYWPQIQDIRGWSAKQVYKKAMHYSQKAAQYSPQDYSLVMDYAVNFFAGERCGVKVSWKKAAKAWQAARLVARNDEERFYTWLNEARAWMFLKDNKQATLCLNAALALKPDSPVAQNMLKKVTDETAKAAGKRKDAGH